MVRLTSSPRLTTPFPRAGLGSRLRRASAACGPAGRLSPGNPGARRPGGAGRRRPSYSTVPGTPRVTAHRSTCGSTHMWTLLARSSGLVRGRTRFDRVGGIGRVRTLGRGRRASATGACPSSFNSFIALDRSNRSEMKLRSERPTISLVQPARTPAYSCSSVGT